MKLLLTITAILALAYLKSHGAPVPTPAAAGPSLTIGAEPYGMISWTGVNGQAEQGAGLAIPVAITKNLAIVGFGEADNVTETFVDRFGVGLRYTAQLGSRVSLDGGVGGGYDLEDPHFFLRLPVGATLYAYKGKSAELGFRVQYAFDISGDLHDGRAIGRLFYGLVGNYRF